MYKETLKQLVETTPISSISSKIKLSQKYKDIYNWILQQTSFLPQDVKLTERIYCILNDITQPVTCKVCDKPLNFKSFTEGYGKYCSTKCACKDPEYIKKREETNLKKYGSKSFLGTETCLNKTKQTLKQKYGVDNIQKVPEIRKKTQQTNLKKYGSKSPLGNEVIYHRASIRARESIINKYGVDNTAKVESIKQKISQAHKSETTKQKKKETLKRRYGVNAVNVSQIPAIKNKIRKTMRNMFGGWKGQEQILHIDKYHDANFWQKNFIDDEGYLDVRTCSTFFGISYQTVYAQAKRLNLDFKVRRQISFEEREVLAFIQELRPDLEIRLNTRDVISPLEIDIYIPDLKLGIEYDGLYWHSVGKQPYDNLSEYDYQRDRLKRKFTEAHNRDILLLDIYDLEWHDEIKGKIWKSIIKYKLGLATRIHARDCKVVELDSDTTTNFLIHNHLQGPVIGASVRLGLIWEDEVVAVMTFGKSRYTEHEWELYRFANKINLTVVGGMSKLFTYFIDHYEPTSVISYANKRWSKGDVYKKLGFKIAYETGLGYFYLDPKMRVVSRQSVQKYMLSKKLEHFDPNKTELENLLDHGYRIVFTTGNYACVWEDSYCK